MNDEQQPQQVTQRLAEPVGKDRSREGHHDGDARLNQHGAGKQPEHAAVVTPFTNHMQNT